MSKDTCKKEKCKLWQSMQEGCPNHFINTFYPMGKSEEAYQINDCAPVRTMLLIKEQHDLLVGMRAEIEHLKDSQQSALSPVHKFIHAMREILHVPEVESEEEHDRVKSITGIPA